MVEARGGSDHPVRRSPATAVRDLARRFAPELCCIPSAPGERGARNAGLWPARGPVCVDKQAHEQVTTEQPKDSGVPRAVFSKACSARPPVWLHFLATAAGVRPRPCGCGIRSAAATTAPLGRRAYVAGTARLGPAGGAGVRLAPSRGHRPPPPRRDDREAPLRWGGVLRNIVSGRIAVNRIVKKISAPCAPSIVGAGHALLLQGCGSTPSRDERRNTQLPRVAGLHCIISQSRGPEKRALSSPSGFEPFRTAHRQKPTSLVRQAWRRPPSRSSASTRSGTVGGLHPPEAGYSGSERCRVQKQEKSE
jgi:hypothetical protein